MGIVYEEGRFRAAHYDQDGKPDLGVADGRYTVDIGYVDGRPAECFCNGSKVGSHIEALINDSAIALALLLQYGLTAEELRERFSRHPDGGAASPLGAMIDAVIADQALYADEWEAGREAVAWITPRRWIAKAP